jgi:hypothetical protein
MDEAVRLLRSGEAAVLRLVKLQAVLDPGQPIEYAHTVMNEANLSKLILAAGRGDKNAIDWLDAVRSHRILGALAEATGSKQQAQADYLLYTWTAQANNLIGGLYGDYRALAHEALRSESGRLFQVALSNGRRDAAVQAWTTDSRRMVSQLPGNSDTGYAQLPDFIRRVVSAVNSAGDDDLGTMLVARAVLVKEGVERRAAERQLRADKIKANLAQRKSNLRDQFGPRMGLCVAYTGACAVAALFRSGLDWEAIGESALQVAVRCVIALAITLVADWITNSPEGAARRSALLIGFAVGAMPWLLAVSVESVPARFMTFSMPVAVCSAYCCGVAVQWLINLVTEGGRVRGLPGLNWLATPALWVGALAIVGGYTSIESDGMQNTVGPVWLLDGLFELLSLGVGTALSSSALVAVGGVVCLLATAAVPLSRFSRFVGAVAALGSLALAAWMFLGNPLDVLWAVLVCGVTGVIAGGIFLVGLTTYGMNHD